MVASEEGAGIDTAITLCPDQRRCVWYLHSRGRSTSVFVVICKQRLHCWLNQLELLQQPTLSSVYKRKPQTLPMHMTGAHTTPHSTYPPLPHGVRG